jgi:hypothetical protein
MPCADHNTIRARRHVATDLIHARHHCPLRRAAVQADDIDDLLHEQRVTRQLERADNSICVRARSNS